MKKLFQNQQFQWVYVTMVAILTLAAIVVFL